MSSIEDDPTGEYPTLSPRRPWVNVEFGAHTDAGKVRDRNEDQFLIAKLAKSMRIWGSSLPEPQITRFSDEEGYLMIVADGMGGVAGGQEASEVAVRTVESFVLDAIKWFLHREGSEQNCPRERAAAGSGACRPNGGGARRGRPQAQRHGHDAHHGIQRGD